MTEEAHEHLGIATTRDLEGYGEGLVTPPWPRCSCEHRAVAHAAASAARTVDALTGQIVRSNGEVGRLVIRETEVLR
jgi:hypothetical protein